MSYKNQVFDALIVLKLIRTSGEGSTGIGKNIFPINCSKDI